MWENIWRKDKFLNGYRKQAELYTVDGFKRLGYALTFRRESDKLYTGLNITIYFLLFARLKEARYALLADVRPSVVCSVP